MRIVNLTHHLFDQHDHSSQARELAILLNQIVLTAKIASREINKAGLVDIIGAVEKTNTYGEEVQKLDKYTNDLFLNLLRQIPLVRAVGSEELEELVQFDENAVSGQYIVMLDPLDGSSNIDVNVSIGSIFSIFRKKSKGKTLKKSDYLQPASEIIAAGYIIYGSSTMLVYSSGYGVHGFTLDQSIGEFLLSHEHMKIPEVGSIYSVNESYSPIWDEATVQYIEQVKSRKDISKKPKSARYIGSLVADFHRNFLKGGIYLYPADKKNKDGKLRLVFEAQPLGYLAYQAGGKVSNGTADLFTVIPKKLHQRTPLILGSAKDVQQFEEF